MIKKCQGCGYTLQSDDSSKLGYVPKTKNKNPKLCERCFKIIHYNDAKIVTLPIEENKILNIVNKSDNHSLFLIDFLFTIIFHFAIVKFVLPVEEVKYFA